MIGEGEDWWGGGRVRVESVDEQTIFVSVTDIMANYSNSRVDEGVARRPLKIVLISSSGT